MMRRLDPESQELPDWVATFLPEQWPVAPDLTDPATFHDRPTQHHEHDPRCAWCWEAAFEQWSKASAAADTHAPRLLRSIPDAPLDERQLR